MFISQQDAQDYYNMAALNRENGQYLMMRIQELTQVQSGQAPATPNSKSSNQLRKALQELQDLQSKFDYVKGDNEDYHRANAKLQKRNLEIEAKGDEKCETEKRLLNSKIKKPTESLQKLGAQREQELRNRVKQLEKQIEALEQQGTSPAEAKKFPDKIEARDDEIKGSQRNWKRQRNLRMHP